MSTALGAVALLVAGLLPPHAPRRDVVARALGGLGVLSLLPAASSSSTWPLLLLAAGAVVLATPLGLVLASAGALEVALGPEGQAPIGAAVAGLAVAAAAEGLAAGERERSRASGGTAAILTAGVLSLAALASVDRGAALAWSFGLGEGSTRVVLPGAGLVLGLALLLGLAGVLLLGGAALAPGSPAARRVGLVALRAAAVLCLLGALGTTARVVLGGEGPFPAGALSVAALLATAGALAAVLQERAPVPDGGAAAAARAAGATAVATGLCFVALGAAGVESWWRAGTYLTSGTLAAASAALLGLAALEPTRLAGTRRLAFLLALIGILAVG